MRSFFRGRFGWRAGDRGRGSAGRRCGSGSGGGDGGCLSFGWGEREGWRHCASAQQRCGQHIGAGQTPQNGHGQYNCQND